LPLLLIRLVAAGGLLHIISEYGFEIIICEGPSMHPTIFPQGDIILVSDITTSRA
jgi:signal peptidase I